ncbi:MAG: hypothetical protein E7166_01105 [Firmicutes bacterium]|nr:hypothetical protein [Bacillota bacterium]
MKSILNESEIESSIKKIIFYKNQEQINFDALSDNLNEINYNYDTNNSEKLYDLYLELSNKLNIINKIHTKYIDVLDKTLLKYRENKTTVANIFDDII